MSSLFPLFRQRFINESAWFKESAQPDKAVSSEEPVVKMAGPAGPRGTAAGSLARPLALDLNFLPRDDGPLSESVLKRQKFAVYEKQCSEVAEGLFVSGEAVARDRGILARHNISHVINCVGALYPEYFSNDGIQYRTLWLQDHPSEDITCILYDTFDFIEAARMSAATPVPAADPPQQQQQQLQIQQCEKLADIQQQQQPMQQIEQQQQQQQQQTGVKGRVLVHCSQGVSRSTTIAIAYLMWKTGKPYEEVYQTVRALRGVTSPNVGFMCQLINWAKRRERPPSHVRLYRIAPHCVDTPAYLVPKAVSPRPGCSYPDWRCLDSRGCFVAYLPDKLYAWRGKNCLAAMADAGIRAAGQLTRYEGAPAVELIRQGEEPDDLLAALNPNSGTGDDSGLASMEPSTTNLVGLATAASGPKATAQGDSKHIGDMSMPGSRPSSSRQPAEQHNQQQGGQRQQQQHEQASNSSSAGTGPLQDHGQQHHVVVQLPQGLLDLVGEVEEYSNDHNMWFRALLKTGGDATMHSGRMTPRGSIASLVVDDMAAGSSCSGRSDSPASQEGRNRKYRRSDNDSHFKVPSFRQPPRLSFSNNHLSPLPGTTAATTVGTVAAAAPAGNSSATSNSTAVPNTPNANSDSGGSGSAAAWDRTRSGRSDYDGLLSPMGLYEAARGDIKRMSIDEGDDKHVRRYCNAAGQPDKRASA